MRRAGAGIPTSLEQTQARGRAPRLLPQVEVGGDRLDELPPDGVQRIERGQRVLEHRADFAAANAAHRFLRQIVDAPAGKTNLAARDAPGRIDQADDRGAGERLAGAGFAHDAEHLARRDRERDIVDRGQRSAARRKLDAQMLDDQQGSAALRASRRMRPGERGAAPLAGVGAAAVGTGGPRDYRSLGLSASRSQSPSRLIASTMITSAAPGKTVIHHSPEKRKSLPTRISVPSEGCVGGTPMPRNDSVASVMIAVAMLIVASTSTGPSTFGSRCRRMMRERSDADDARGVDVILVLLDHRRAAHGARVLHPVGNADREDQHEQRDRAVRVARQHRAGHAVDQQRDQDGRKRKLNVGDAHDEGVELAADVSGDQSQAHAQHHREQHRREADEQRDPRAEHDRRQQVAALIVGAEQIFRPRRRPCRAEAPAHPSGSASPDRTDCAARPTARRARRQDR